MVSERLQRIVFDAVSALDYELVGCEFIPRRHQSILRVFIDKPGGVNVEDCATASRHLGGILDVEEVIPGSYNLEVSSPGIERPLFTLAHFEKYIGSQVWVELKAVTNGRRKLTGELTAVKGEDILITEVTGQVVVPFSKIKKAHLVF